MTIKLLQKSRNPEEFGVSLPSSLFHPLCTSTAGIKTALKNATVGSGSIALGTVFLGLTASPLQTHLLSFWADSSAFVSSECKTFLLKAFHGHIKDPTSGDS